MANINRRAFLNGAGALGFLGGAGVLSGLNAMGAHAADTTGYKALVCIFLKGGIDHADTVLPYDQPSYDMLRGVRTGLFNTYNANSSGSSRNRQNLLKLNPENAGDFGGREFALPVQLSPLHDMFESGELAVVGNVGPLIEPTTRTQYEARSVALPKRLFSHNDQQSTWMALGVEGARFGWGGKFADAALASDPSANPLFAAITARSNDVFLSGETARQFQAQSGGPVDLNVIQNRSILGRNDAADAARARMQEFFARSDFGSSNLFERDSAAASGRAVQNTEDYKQAVENGLGISTVFPNSGLGGQLRTVAETIAIRNLLGVGRQVFYVTDGGYDTHSNQAGSLTNRHTQIAEAMAAFRTAMLEIGDWNNVTMFTMSDFGRTTIDNGDGTDHGWGGHHFVAGGAVNGKRVYGDIPQADLGSEDYTRSRGRLIPGISVEQYAASLGSWFGLDQNELNAALPNLQNFNASGVDVFV